MILELDAGNTRIKWRLLKAVGNTFVKEEEGSVLAKKKTSSVFVELGEQLDELPLKDIAKVRVSSVRGEEFGPALGSWMNEKWQLKAEFAESKKRCGGLTNSYDDVARMGVDRWLAMLAAYKKAQGACCVIDCGSAVTVDVISEEGLHLGGYIVPGLNLMQEALVVKSAVLNSTQNAIKGIGLGKDTGSAIRNGLLGMVLGLLDRVNAECKDSDISWFLTGGDALLVSSFLEYEHEVVLDLVMDGLAISIP